VINVSFEDAMAYVAWLSRKTGKSYRLLSEAEWEYVTRAGTATVFWWGDTISTAQANYDGNYTFGHGGKGEYRKKTVPVNSFEPNPWGLTMYTAMSWSGARMFSTRTTTARRRTDRLGSKAVMKVAASLAAATGAPILIAFVRPAATVTSGLRCDGVGFRIARTLTP
jgi:hypothetical protein